MKGGLGPMSFGWGKLLSRAGADTGAAIRFPGKKSGFARKTAAQRAAVLREMAAMPLIGTTLAVSPSFFHMREPLGAN